MKSQSKLTMSSFDHRLHISQLKCSGKIHFEFIFILRPLAELLFWMLHTNKRSLEIFFFSSNTVKLFQKLLLPLTYFPTPQSRNCFSTMTELKKYSHIPTSCQLFIWLTDYWIKHLTVIILPLLLRTNKTWDGLGKRLRTRDLLGLG